MMNASEGELLAVMQKFVIKTIQDIDTIYRKTLVHIKIEDIITYDQVVILISTIEASKNLFVRTVAYSSIKKSIIVLIRELKGV